MQNFIGILPKIAGHPLAIVAYVLLAVVWLVAYLRRKRTDDFLLALDRVPEADRREFAEESGYKYDELAQLSQRDRRYVLTSRYLLIAFVSTVVAFALVFVATVMVINDARRTPRGDRHYTETSLDPGIYKSGVYDPSDLTQKTMAITTFLRSLGYDSNDFGNFPIRLISPVSDGDAGDLQVLRGSNGKKYYRLTVSGDSGVPQRILLRTESE